MSPSQAAKQMVASLMMFLFAACLCVLPSAAQNPKHPTIKIVAQQIVEETIAVHPEIDSLELSTTPPNDPQCVTIASTDSKEIGEKCDKVELATIKSNQPHLEKENENGKQIYDVTVPIHDSNGQSIGTAGMDFKADPQGNQSKIIDQAKQIGKELDLKITSKEKLFHPAT